jgi:hypothetical protein
MVKQAPTKNTITTIRSGMISEALELGCAILAKINTGRLDHPTASRTIRSSLWLQIENKERPLSKKAIIRVLRDWRAAPTS